MVERETKPEKGSPDNERSLSTDNQGGAIGPGSPTVRFASVNQEIAPTESLGTTETTSLDLQKLSTEEEKQVRNLSSTLQGTHLQERRMSRFAFEPVSLPTSRVPSNEESSREASRLNTQSSGRPSPLHSPETSSMHTPPITPALTRSQDAISEAAKNAILNKGDVDSELASPSGPSPSTTNVEDSRPGSSSLPGARPMSQPTASSAPDPRHHSTFSIGPGAQDSVPTSREVSPTRVPTGPVYSRPFTPGGDANDPYAAHKRPPQSKNLDNLDSRFKFTAVGSKHRSSPSSSSLNLPRSSRSNTGMSDTSTVEKKSTLSRLHHEDSFSSLSSKHHGSMSELKRFLKLGGHHKAKRPPSPTGSNKSGTKTPPHHKTPQQLPFGDDHGLTSKYGKFGKVLGAGAGGSVRLMKRSSDNTTFAVKEFRARHSYESEKEYAKKVTAEFCVGSTLHHGNIIETLDIVHEKGRWYEVMEYAPYDLFAVVMTGKMSREEVSCCFLQILSGVTYLHSMGLAHRDLKLDNVVVNEHGIMKIIDFGSASVFKYPFENGTVSASGIVGSDPYLAPEVYDQRTYDPQAADIWSLAIIFCCMSLRRFPWKMPRTSDNSFRLFASPPSPGTDMKRLSVEVPHNSKSTTNLDTPARDVVPESNANSQTDPSKSDAAPANGSTAPTTSEASDISKKPEVIKGPWRLLRLLPRESRHIISMMLEIDPQKRATMTAILDDTWVSGTDICRQDDGGKIYRAAGHTHTLEPPSPPAPVNK